MKTAVDKKPGKIETRLSMALIAILLIVAIGVFMRQFQINPAVVALRPEAHQPNLPSALHQASPIDTTGTGMAPFSPPERFNPDTLYEKINGRADLYLSSGFASLNTQRFSMEKSAGAWVVGAPWPAAAAEPESSESADERHDEVTRHARPGTRR